MQEVYKEGWPHPCPLLNEEKVHMEASDAHTTIANAIYEYGLPWAIESDEIITLCIGTDRSIGDALGPLVGSHLIEHAERAFLVLGTLDAPVHASNLCETLTYIEHTYNNPLVIAVDACLGRAESVGILTVGKGSLKPGAGVNKALPPVGQIYVTGVVNVGGFMEYFVLQNTRLGLVSKMAKVVSHGLRLGLAALIRGRANRTALKQDRISK